MVKIPFIFRFVYGPPHLHTKVLEVDTHERIEHILKRLYELFKFGPYRIELRQDTRPLATEKTLHDYYADGDEKIVYIYPIR